MSDKKCQKCGGPKERPRHKKCQRCRNRSRFCPICAWPLGWAECTHSAAERRAAIETPDFVDKLIDNLESLLEQLDQKREDTLTDLGAGG